MVIDEPRLLGVAFAGGYLMAAYHSRREAQLHAHQLVLSHVSTTDRSAERGTRNARYVDLTEVRTPLSGPA